MTIKELETRTGMTRANIRFYENEGLIAPSRLPNGYRDYSERDVHKLLKIKLLRRLQISLSDIKAIVRGNRLLDEVLEVQLQTLQQAQEDMSLAASVCETMLADHVAFSELNAMQYLMTIETGARERRSDYFEVKGDELPQVHQPWRRFFARFFDMMLYSSLWSASMMLFFNQNPSLQSDASSIIEGFIVLMIMLFVEPVWLHFFGTTPGKALLGLKVESDDGGRLTYGQGVARTWGIIGKGLGYNIPFYNLYRIWKSYRMCSDLETLPWDEDIAYTLKDSKKYRYVTYIGGIALLIFMLYTATAMKLLPPNRGDLTVADFAENYNYYLKYFQMDSDQYYLDDNGQWAEQEQNGSTVYLGIGFSERPVFTYEVVNGTLVAVGFETHIVGEERWVGSNDQYMVLSGLAFANGQKTVGLYSKLSQELVNAIDSHTFESFEFSQDGIQMRADVTYAGYNDFDSGVLIPMDGASSFTYDLLYEIRSNNE
ncbi:MerR family transcriptional regulator [Fusibacter paucivorans]|uniref:MerR family transcriptional regulator n=1 Tax=Fusibacter paucivorans TaxID=76009 RepID=A0ABS5PTD5_9FIRM|nr:MerR family transcriptional regulator [Fusibacter paucivorans]MBS7527644.1 MerR family transcriptional regulator [Fusibacter paucivorans]